MSSAKLLRGSIRQALPIGTVVGDRPTVGLVAADGELDGPHAEGLRCRSDGLVGDAVDPRCAEVGDEAVTAIGPDPPAHAVASLEHDDVSAGLRQQPGGGQSGHPRADHDRLEMIHPVPFPQAST